ncbi:MAG: hypothetical protein ABI353_14140 [Isosphaeraceae bacterium]
MDPRPLSELTGQPNHPHPGTLPKGEGVPSLAELARRLDRLERANRVWRRLALTGFALVVLLAASTLGRPRPLAAQQPEPAAVKAVEGSPDHVKFAEDRLRLAKKAIGIVNELADRGFQIANQRQDYYRWSYRMLGDQIYLSLTDADPRVADPEVYLAVTHAKANPARFAAFTAHLKRMIWWEDLNRPLARKGTISVLAYSDVQAARIEAELWLARERLKETDAAQPLKSGPANGPLTPDQAPGSKE